MAAFNDKQAVDPVHGLVFGNNQATDIPLELDERLGRENVLEEMGIVLHQFGTNLSATGEYPPRENWGAHKHLDIFPNGVRLS